MPQGPQPQLSCHSPRCSRPRLESALHRRAGQRHLSCRHPIARSVGSQSSPWHGWHCSWTWWPVPFWSPPSHQQAAHRYQGMPGGSGPCICVSAGSPWLDRGTGQPHRPRWDPHREGLGGILGMGGIGKGKVGMWKEQFCRYLGSRNAHTRHA